MLRLLLLSTLFPLFLFSDSTKEGLSYLNNLRTNSGLIKLESSKELSTAAKSHAKYLIRNQTNGHYEKKGKYSYTGVKPSDRVIKAGYSSRVTMENISLNTTSHKKSIDNLFSAIYHRFVFLNLDKDEIGLGEYNTKKKRAIKQAYVYNLGSSSMSNLCKKSYMMVSGQYYMKNICSKGSKMVPQRLFKKKEDDIRRKNSSVIYYPYAGQEEIWPAFYNESPDPLPRYKVSGFPISVQFNPTDVKKVKLKSFRLFNEKGVEVKKVKILHKENDPNHKFTDLEFALMPLARLEFDRNYTVTFDAKVDGTTVKKKWTFRTKKFKEKLYRINQNKTTIRAKAGASIILYMVPNNRRDILHGYSARGDVKATFLDQNTLHVTLPKKRSSDKVFLSFGKSKKVSFLLQ